MVEEGPRVLVVDDDPLMKSIVAAALGSGYRVLTAGGGEAALGLLAREPIDLVVLDVDMPDLDGYETCRRLRATEAGTDLPVIFLSGHAGIDERLKGYAAGGDDYMVKPGERAELRAKVELALRARQRQREMASQLEEMTNTAMSTADMMGDAGVVLTFQRQLAHCQSYERVADAVMEALGNFALEGCVRVRGASRATRNARGEATALESSILDHLERLSGDKTVLAVGSHTGIRMPHVLLFVRALQVDRPADMPRDVAERMGRHIDNIALLAEGADAQVQAIDARRAVVQLEGSRRLVHLTREALMDISARDQAQRQQVSQIFAQLNSAVEDCFISLGLTASQEDHLAEVIRHHGHQVDRVLDGAREVHERLTQVIRQLEASA